MKSQTLTIHKWHDTIFRNPKDSKVAISGGEVIVQS